MRKNEYVEFPSLKIDGKFRYVWKYYPDNSIFPSGLAEFSDGSEGQVMSAKSYMKYDCDLGKFRVEKMTYYSELFLKGSSKEIINKGNNWRTVEPGSFKEMDLTFICTYHPFVIPDEALDKMYQKYE